MSEPTLSILGTAFKEQTGLKDDQFIFSQKFGDHVLYVVQDGALKELGSISHQGYVRNGLANQEDTDAALKFIELCAQKVQDNSVEVPPLVAHKQFLNPVYKV